MELDVGYSTGGVKSAMIAPITQVAMNAHAPKSIDDASGLAESSGF